MEVRKVEKRVAGSVAVVDGCSCANPIRTAVKQTTSPRKTRHPLQLMHKTNTLTSPLG